MSAPFVLFSPCQFPVLDPGSASGTQLRLVVTAQIVGRVLRINGLDRLISIYPSLEAAIAARVPAALVPLLPLPGACSPWPIGR